MGRRTVRITSLVALGVAFGIDLVTPQLFVAAILFDAPIALSTLALDARFTMILVRLALAGDVVAGYVNGVVEHHWDGIALANRAAVACSFVLVGALCVATQRTSARAGELAARAERISREGHVHRALERVQGWVDPETVRRAIVHEACAGLDVDVAVLVAFERGRDEPTTYRGTAGEEVVVTRARPIAGLHAAALRAADERRPVRIASTDVAGDLVLADLGVAHACAAAVVDRDEVHGTLVVGRRTVPFAETFDDGAMLYVDRAAAALGRARLFAEIAERNVELASANVALAERGDVIRDLVYALSHDLRTPLVAAGMTLRQASDGAYGAMPPAYLPILARSIDANDELRRLAETLVLVSRYEAGEGSRRRDPVALVEIARAAALELEPLWRERELTVDVVAEAARADVAGDASELRRATTNLLANAIASSRAGGAVTLRVTAAAGEVELAVDDDGFGVAETIRPRLFQRLEGDARAGAGTGLGLYLVRRVVEAHGGAVRYEPRASGGSRFALRLPVFAASETG